MALLDAEGLDSRGRGRSLDGRLRGRADGREPPRAAGSVVLVDGGPPLPVPDGADPDALLEATLGPSIERLSKEFDRPRGLPRLLARAPGVRRLRRTRAGSGGLCGPRPAWQPSAPALERGRAGSAHGRPGVDRRPRRAYGAGDHARARGAAARPAGAARSAGGVHPGRHRRDVRPPDRGPARGARQQPLHDPDGRRRGPRGGGRDPRAALPVRLSPLRRPAPRSRA